MNNKQTHNLHIYVYIYIYIYIYTLQIDEAERNMGLNEYDVDSFKQMIGGIKGEPLV